SRILNNLPRAVIKLAVRLRLDLILVPAGVNRDDMPPPLPLDPVNAGFTGEVDLRDQLSRRRRGYRCLVRPAARSIGVKELQAGKAVQENLVAGRIAQRAVDAQNGNLKDVPRHGVAHDLLFFLDLAGVLLQADAVGLVEAADAAAAAAAKSAIDFAVH